MAGASPAAIGGAARRPQTPWWVLTLALSFFSYFGLLVYCDLNRPEDYGIHGVFEDGHMRIDRVIAGSPADRAGLEAGDVILRVGPTPIRGVFDWDVVSSHLRIDVPKTVIGVRGGREFSANLTLQFRSLDYWLTRPAIFLLLTLAVQLVSLVVALVIVLKRPEDATARLGALLLATVGVFKIALPYRVALVWTSVPLPFSLLFWIPHFSDVTIAAVLAAFAASFPRRLRLAPWAWIAMWVPMLAAVVPAAAQWFTLLYRPEDPMLVPYLSTYQTTMIGGYTAAALIAMVVNFRRVADVNERRRIKVLVFGAVGGLAPGFPVVATYWLRSHDNLAESIFASGWTSIGTLSFLCFPASFIYAILWQHLFDIRVIIRRGMQYALARRGLLALVPALVLLVVADLAAHRSAPLETVARSRGWAYAAVAAGIIIANSRRQRWMDSLDRRFFREQYDAQRILKSVAEDIRATGDLEGVAPRVVAQIDAALHPRFVAIVARDTDDLAYRVMSSVPADLDLPSIRADSKLVSLVRVLGKPLNLSAEGSAWLAGQLPPQEMASFAASGVELVVPMSPTPASREAALLLGLKRSEEPYSVEDCDLLGLIAGNLELLMSRGAMTDDVAAKGRFDECPVCGACFDTGARHCANDGAELTGVPGSRMLGARYRLELRLGQGGLGTVYAAHDAALDRTVAVKVVRHDLVATPDLARRFQLEAKLAAAFVHPNVVTVHDFGTSGGRAFIVMERLTGLTLRAYLDGGRQRAAARALEVMRHVCAAVAAAHDRRVIHRDLKPENIFLVDGDPAGGVKVLDFGIAKLVSGTRSMHSTAAGSLVGTLAYMAPELLRGEEPSAACDLWALGLIAHELLTGTHPFAMYAAGLPGADAPVVGSALGAAAQRFFQTALAIEPNRRFATAPDLLAGFSQIVVPSS